MKNRKKLFTLLFIFIILFSGLLAFSQFGLATIQEEDYSNPEGTLINVGKNYWYSGTFWDDTDPDFTWTTGEIQFTYIEDPTVTYEHAITSFENHETNNPESSDISLYHNTTVYDSSKMDSNDNAYSYFDRDGLGVYNATYGFESDNVGSDPSGWTVGETGGTVNIVYELDGHKKVVELDDTGTNSINLYQTITGQTSGTVEYWIQSTDVTYQSQFRIYDGSNYIIFMMDSESFWYYNGSWTDLGVDSKDGVWYHIRAVFNCPSSSLQIFINGIDSGTYILQGSLIEIDKIFFGTIDTDQNYKFYIDAVDYNWTSGYSLNRNAEPLYSLEHYPATYSFEEDDILASGGDISWVTNDLSGVNTSAIIIDSWQGHSKVLKCTVLDVEYDNNLRIYHGFPNQVDPTFEFWISADTITSANQIYISNEGSLASVKVINIVQITGSNIKITHGDGNGGSTTTALKPISENIWYHIKISLNFETDKTSIWIDGEYYSAWNFYNDQDFSYLNSLTIRLPADVLYSCYFDAFGYSWEDYTIGDNLYYNHFLGSETFESYNQTVSGNYYGSDSFEYNTEEGVFYGTHDFRDEVGETTEANIDFIDDLNYGSVEVISSLDSHKAVLKLFSGSTIIYTYFDTYRNSGIVEFWYYKTGLSDTDSIRFYEDTTTRMELYAHNNDRWVYHDGTTYISKDLYSANTWYHHAIEWYSDNTFDWIVDGSLMVDGDTIKSNMSSGVNNFQLTTTTNEDVYIDAFGESWDTTSHSGLGYTVGWNINPYDLEPLLEDYMDLLLIGYNTSVSISSCLDGHNNVLKISDSSSSHYALCGNYFATQTFGTIEFWFRTTDATEFNYVSGRGTGGDAFYIAVVSDEFAHYVEGTGWIYSGITALDDTWYHFRIDFECAGGGYQGLSADKFDLIINGTTIIDDGGFRHGNDDVDELRIHTSTGDMCDMYIDALGYSGDSDYDIDDNTNSHGKEVITALESNGWFFSYLNPYTSVGISGVYSSHKKIINFTDNTATGLSRGTHLFSTHSTGTMEFYLKTSAITKPSYFDIYDGGVVCFRINIDNGKLRYYSGGYVDIIPISNNIWYHVRLSWDVSNNWICFIDGIEYTVAKFNDMIDGVDRVMINTGTADLGYSLYVDSLSYSWENDVGTNLHCNEAIVINTVISIPFDIQTDALQINIDSRHFTSELMNITWSIYNFNSDKWEIIDNSTASSETLFEFDDITNPSYYFNESNHLKLKYYGFNGTAMYFMIDELEVSVYFKTEFSYQKALNLIGTWKYRFCLDEGLGTEHTSDWIYINVVQFEPNVELVSESEYYTEWEILGSDFTENDLYKEDFESSYDNWILSGVVEDSFNIYPSEIGNYLLNNFSDIITHEGDFDLGTPRLVEGITSLGYFLYVVEDYDLGSLQRVHKYSLGGTYFTNFDISNEDVDPRGITSTASNLWVVGDNTDTVYKYTTSGTYMGTNFSVSSQTTSPAGITFDGDYFYVLDGTYDIVYQYTFATGTYTGEFFSVMIGIDDPDPTGITYSNGYFWVIGDAYNKVYKFTHDGDYTGINFNSVELQPTGITWEDVNEVFRTVGILQNDADEYSWVIDTSKIYNEDGYFYIQTNETETLKVRSKDNLNLNLLSGDKIEIQFNTSSSNKIDINFLNNGVDQKSYEISKQGNLNYNTHYTTISIDSDMTVDQLEFEGIFDDTKNMFIENIRIYRYISSGEIIEEIVDPDGIKHLFLEYPTDLTCNVYENSLLMYSVNFTASYNITVLIYEVPKVRENYITYFDTNNEYLDFNLFTSYINYTFGGESIVNERLSDRIISVDDDTLISFKIYDSFNVLVKTYQQYEETFIDITLSVYSLKIKNEAMEYTEYDLSKSGSSIIKSGNIFSGEIIEFHIASGSYSLDYINHEDMYSREYNFTLSDHKIISINTTYHQVYFSLFTYDGLGIDHDLVRFYINNERKDLGFNTIQTESIDLVVLDFFNNTLANETIDASAYSEYNIFVEIYTLVIINDFDYEDIICNITQVNSSIWMSQIIPSGLGLNYRFLPNVEYNITIYYENKTLYDSKIVNLTSNNHIESFGIPSGISEYPKDVYFSIFNYDGLGLEFNLFKFYLNNNRTDFGFNRIENMIVHIEVKDYYDSILVEKYINTSGIYEYNIQVKVYTAILVNNFNRTIQVEIKRGSNEDIFILGSRSGIEIKLLPNVEYTFTAYENDGEYIKEKEVDLDEDYKVISFGFYEEKVPYRPEDLANSYNNTIMFLVLLAGIILIIVAVVGYFKKKSRESREKRYNSRLDHKLKPSSHTRSLGG